MKTAITSETAGAVKARQGIVPAWMDAFADDDRVVVVTAITPFGRYTLEMMRPASDMTVDEHDIATEHAPIDGGDLDDLDDLPAGFHIVGRTPPPPACFRPKACDTCGERLNGAAAEVVRDGRHVLVHADTCMRDGEEVA